MRVCAGWSEPLLVAHTTLLEILCRGSFDIINPLFTGNPSIGTFTNSEDPDEMGYNVAFQQGLH